MAGLKNLKKTRRIQIILVAFVALALSTALIGYAMKDGINYFRSPTQVTTEPPRAGEVFRIGGLVEVGSLVRGQGDTITFSVTDTKTTVPVRFTGVLPDLFAEGAGITQGVVIIAPGHAIGIGQLAGGKRGHGGSGGNGAGANLTIGHAGITARRQHPLQHLDRIGPGIDIHVEQRGLNLGRQCRDAGAFEIVADKDIHRLGPAQAAHIGHIDLTIAIYVTARIVPMVTP